MHSSAPDLTAGRTTTCRYVALGDSFTEGVGDPHERLPNGVRGWADRVAEGLAKAAPGWEYANLAIRSKRLRHVIAEQLPVAIAMEPTLVTLYAGGNDILDLGTDMPSMLAQYESLVEALVATGATVVLFTGYNVQVSPLLLPLQRRNNVYNERVRQVARRNGAVLVDYASFEAYRDRRMWAPDRLHMSKAGHKYLARQVLATLGVARGDEHDHGPSSPRRTLREWQRMQRAWVRDWVIPLLHRKARGVTLGDDLRPRWPVPVVVPPKGGLRRLSTAP